MNKFMQKILEINKMGMQLRYHVYDDNLIEIKETGMDAPLFIGSDKEAVAFLAGLSYGLEMKAVSLTLQLAKAPPKRGYENCDHLL